jgi:type I restriction enzyme, S subunit
MRELPIGWEYRRVDQVGDVQIGRQRSPSVMTGPYIKPYLRVANVLDGYIDYSDVLEMNFTPYEAQIYELRHGDVLLNEGQALDLVGRCAVFDGPSGMCFQNTLLRFRPRDVLPRFAVAIFKHWLHRGEFRKLSRQTTSIAHLGVGQFSAMPFPVAPAGEQRRMAEILDDADQAISTCELALEKTIAKQKAMSLSLLETMGVANTLADVLIGSPKNGIYKPASEYGPDGTRIVRIDSMQRGEINSFASLLRVLLSDAERALFSLENDDILINRVNSIDYVGKSAIVRQPIQHHALSS